MKDKNLPPDNNSQSLEELTKNANNIIESLEAQKDLQSSIDSYHAVSYTHLTLPTTPYV